jgi:hypothetical protein
MNWWEIFFFFVIFGILGVFIEVIATSIQNFVRQKDRCMNGHSSFWMFFVYGSVYFIVLFVTTYFPTLNIILRGIIYMFLFYSLEFVSGFFFKKCRILPWDYSKETKYHYKGIIRFDFAPFWFIGGLIYEAVYLFLKTHLIF